jgi:hypothetical protein
MNFFEKVKGLLLNPSKTFDATKEETFSEVIKYFVVLSVIYSTLGASLLVIAPNLYGSDMQKIPGVSSNLPASIIGMILFVFILIFVIIVVLVDGLFTHILVYLMGGRKGFSQTMKAIIDCTTPQLLLGWIPGLIIIVIVWSIFIEILGIRQLQEISTAKAILATILPTIIAIIILVVLVAVAAFILNPNGMRSGTF